MRRAQFGAQRFQVGGGLHQYYRWIVAERAMHAGERLNAAREDPDGLANGWIGEIAEVGPQRPMQGRE